MPRSFTLAEANAALEIIKPLMEKVQKIRQEIQTQQPETWEVIKRSAGNGGNPEMSRMVKSFDQLDQLVHRILDVGVEIKDLNTGLLDFPALRNGQPVYLCWKSGEDKIEFWHEMDAGFAGRQPIDTF